MTAAVDPCTAVPTAEAVAPEATVEHWVFAPTTKRASVTRVDEDMLAIVKVVKIAVPVQKVLISFVPVQSQFCVSFVPVQSCRTITKPTSAGHNLQSDH